jgi:ComF family protein
MYRQLLGLAFKGIKAATDYLLPYSCISCTNLTQEQDGFCHRCWAKINFIGASLCNICGRAFDINIEELISTCGACLIKKPQYDSARSLMHYDGISKKILHDLKYHDKTSLAKVFSKMIFHKYSLWFDDCDVVVPIPMHKIKRLFRRYNQAQVIAHNIANFLQKPMISNCLMKTKWTKSQTSLTKQQRMTNLEGSFSINNNNAILQKNILLVDDVLTTGSTVNLCAKILKNHGAKQVKVITIAIT